MSQSDTLTERIASKIDKVATGSLAIAKGGNLDFVNLNEIMEVAKVVAISQVAIPKHLRDNVGACLAVCIQASEWRLSPFAVANKSYVVNDRLAFEAQLIASVILKRAPIIGRISYTYTGEGGTRRCKTTATLNDGTGTVAYESPEFDKITTKNSPLWKADPDQQLGYFAVRAMCRRHFPDVLLGIYTPEEMGEAIDVTATVREVPAGRPALFGPAVTPFPMEENSPPAGALPPPADEGFRTTGDPRASGAETTSAGGQQLGSVGQPSRLASAPEGEAEGNVPSQSSEPRQTPTATSGEPATPRTTRRRQAPELTLEGNETAWQRLDNRISAAGIATDKVERWLAKNNYPRLAMLAPSEVAEIEELWGALVEECKS